MQVYAQLRCCICNVEFDRTSTMSATPIELRGCNLVPHTGRPNSRVRLGVQGSKVDDVFVALEPTGRMLSTCPGMTCQDLCL